MSGELDTENGTFDTIDIKNDESSREEEEHHQQNQQQPQNNIGDKANNSFGNGFLEENEDEGDEIFRSSISNSTMSEVTVSVFENILWGGGRRSRSTSLLSHDPFPM